MKAFNNPDQIMFMMDYYNIIKIGRHSTIYYNQIVGTIRKCVYCPKFPHIDS